ncbi:MAG: efflux RND transporter periplasmic adaptor subunit [Gammaproteobacteria bacterium]|nr:efflux RND transporter periplasmic adaptor subunit [Gammaproteobacteria bacterium]
MKRLIKRGLLMLAVVAVLAFAVFAYNNYKAEPETTYVTEPVKRGDIERTVLANGMLQASRLVSVGAQVSGQIESLLVGLGDEVKEGELIARIDSLTQQNSLKEAQASLQSIDAQITAKKAQIKQAELEFARQGKMLAADSSARSEYESAQANLVIYRADLQRLQAERQQAEVKVDSARLDLGYTEITAPMDGTVVYSAVEEGQTVNANQSTPTIVEMAQLGNMTIKAQISEADVVNVNAGQPVYFTILGRPDRRFNATLRAIEPGPTLMDGDDSDMMASDSEAIYYNGLFDVENPQGTLRIGMTAEVSIVLQRAEKVLLVPSQILQNAPAPADRQSAGGAEAVADRSPQSAEVGQAKGNDQARGPAQESERPGAEKQAWYQVPVLTNGELEYRRVRVGINNKIKAEILEGLDEGEQVVTGMADANSSSRNSTGRPPIRF